MADRPAPWRWTPYCGNMPRMVQLLDARGEVVLELPHDEIMAHLDPVLAAAIAGVGDILHAAPGLDLLRASRRMQQDIDAARTGVDPREGIASVDLGGWTTTRPLTPEELRAGEAVVLENALRAWLVGKVCIPCGRCSVCIGHTLLALLEAEPRPLAGG